MISGTETSTKQCLICHACIATIALISFVCIFRSLPTHWRFWSKMARAGF